MSVHVTASVRPRLRAVLVEQAERAHRDRPRGSRGVRRDWAFGRGSRRPARGRRAGVRDALISWIGHKTLVDRPGHFHAATEKTQQLRRLAPDDPERLLVARGATWCHAVGRAGPGSR